jgi:hypothetical protein
MRWKIKCSPSAGIDVQLRRNTQEQDLLIEVTATAIVPEDRYRAPEAIAPDAFDVSDGGFNIQS